MWGVAGIVLALAVASTAEAAERSLAAGVCPARAGEPVSVSSAVDGDSLKLADGRLVRLAGIEVPQPPLGQEGAWPLAEAAQKALAGLAEGQAATLMLSTPKADRYGRFHGDILVAGGRRLAELMVRQGLARVRAADGEGGACMADLLAAERVARAAKLGLWADPIHAIRRADDPSLARRSGLYELVEGRVLSVGHGTRLVFLDFGRDYRRDFTVMLTPGVAAKLAVPADGLVKRRIRVRGIIEESNGPAIRVSDPAEIELLDEEDGAGRQG
jgi:endonuclease YncB( thermonuclease family)